MAMSIVALVAGGPALFATTEAIRQSQHKERRDEHRKKRTNLVIRCSRSSKYSPILEGRRVVLSGNKLYIDTGTDHTQVFGHPFCGYFLKYPERPFEGLVSTIAEDPPIMNWIYVDQYTNEMKFGIRAESEYHYTGPFDTTRQNRRLLFQGWEGFVAILGEHGFWELRVDRDGDLCKGVLEKEEEGKWAKSVVLEVELRRYEIRSPRIVKEVKKKSSSVNVDEKIDIKFENNSEVKVKKSKSRELFVSASSPVPQAV
ncbi:hypothetical protein B0J14DRAFT_636932 [Halenospora varia]|nr:hypothetical protein B0J14DRAFT_636932 [Halenospora varia]